MKKKDSISRREFVKLTAAGGAGLIAGGYLFNIGRAHAADFPKISDINPFIPNTRVVYLKDKDMTTGKVENNWKSQNEATNTNLVGTNFDKLACSLAGEKTTEAAWKKTITKPAGKEWEDTTVAIKTNNIAEQHTRNAVMMKICNVLVNGLGIPGQNVSIYDGCHGGDIDRKSPFFDLPEGVKIQGNWGGINTEAPVPQPFNDKATCVKALAEDKVDILINIAMCKGHGHNFGGFTMLMKNHFGTFNPGLGHRGDGLSYLTSINKSEAVLGKIDEKTGKVLKPRQQLCIIDALWSSQGGPGGPPSNCTNTLFMGTFAPVMDYLVATEFRRDEMNWRVNEDAVERFLTDFGYAKKDIGKLVSAA